VEHLNRQLLQLFANPQFLLPFIIWSIFWKGLALWQSATRRQLLWFIIILIVNTLGFFEIIYISFLHKWDIDNGKLLALIKEKTSVKGS
jgi:hypothetical protein